jgi:predicted RNA-binding protein YlqC (UPF0109 family)
MVTELTEILVKKLVKDPDSISVKEMDEIDEFIIVEVLVPNDDIGAVIGYGGKVASAIRTIVSSAAYNNGLKKVKINFDSF